MAHSLWTQIKGLLIRDETDKTKALSLEIDSAATTNTQTTLKSAQTASRTIVLPDASDTLIGKATTDTLTNKTIDADGTGNVLSNIDDGNIKALAGINATKIANGSVDNIEYQYLNGVTSSIQTQLNTNSTAASTAQTTIDNHIADAIDAHDASAISNIPSGNLAATDVQGALNELQTQMDGLTGTVTNVATGTGLTGGPITTTGTISLANTAVTPGSYTLSSITVDQQGRLTSASNGTAGANVTLSNLTVPTNINTNLTFDNSGSRSITMTDTSSVSAANGLSLLSSANTSTGASGNVTVASASKSLTTGNTGDVNLASGNTPLGGSSSGSVSVQSGTTASAISGAVSVFSGDSSASNTGIVTVTSGTSSSGNSGNTVINTGTATGTRGKIQLKGGSEGTSGQVWTSTDTSGSGAWAAATATPSFSYRAVTTTDSATTADYTLNLSGASFTQTLYTAVGNSGKALEIKHSGTSLTQVYTLATTGGQTIGGFASGSYALYTNGETLVLRSDGSNWIIVEHYTDTTEVESGSVNIGATTSGPTKGTVSLDTLIWYRRGKFAYCRYIYNQTAAGAGAAGTGDYLFSLPFTADTSEISLYTTVHGINSIIKPSNNVGSCFCATATGFTGSLVGGVFLYDSTHFRLGGAATPSSSGNSLSGMISAGFGALSGATAYYSATFVIPVSGWKP